MRHNFLFLVVLGIAISAARFSMETFASIPTPGSEAITPVKLPSENHSHTEATANVSHPSNSIDHPTPQIREQVKKLSPAEGMLLAQKSNCLACHSLDNKVVGPAWRAISNRYRLVTGIEDRLVVKVSTGGYGNWGNIPMPALAPDVKEKDIRTLVRFILDLSK